MKLNWDKDTRWFTFHLGPIESKVAIWLVASWLIVVHLLAIKGLFR
jgi:hypothetical protein